MSSARKRRPEQAFSSLTEDQQQWLDVVTHTSAATEFENLAARKEAGELLQMALAELPADQAAVGAALGKIGPNCGGCHEVYRLKK